MRGKKSRRKERKQTDVPEGWIKQGKGGTGTAGGGGRENKSRIIDAVIRDG